MMSSARRLALRACYQPGEAALVVTDLASRANAKLGGVQSRLMLQDPLAFDQATQPTLRGSMELVEQPTFVMDREKARELWESMSLEPEVAQERQSERKRLLARADTLAREAAAAKAQALELQAQLSQARDERLNHPLVYAGAAGLLGLGALWWLERRKRLQREDRDLALLAHPDSQPAVQEPTPELQDQSSVFFLEDSPDLATDFATDLPGSATKIPAPQTMSAVIKTSVDAAPDAATQRSATAPKNADTPQWAQPKTQASHALPTEEELVALSWQTQDRSLLGMSKRVLGNMLRRRAERQTGLAARQDSTSATTAAPTTAAPSTLLHFDSHDAATQLMYDEEAQRSYELELQAQQHATVASSHNADQANIDLLAQMRIMPHRGENAMEHLLELRTAVNGLCVLGRPEGALRLLEEHVEADPATCAWAYLQSMQLCEQLERRDDFESMRKRYRQQFNRMAPYWHEPNGNVLGLDGYSRATGELCAVWTLGHAQAQAALASWLIGPLLGRKLVQLPAYHDLFDLYEMLEFSDIEQSFKQASSSAPLESRQALDEGEHQDEVSQDTGWHPDPEMDFVPTVSLLDLDYEFSSDVTLVEHDVQQAEKSVTVVKPGNFSVDFNVAGTQIGGLFSEPAELGKK